MNRAVVIGGGADALVAAQLLAAAGREVLVIEGASAPEAEGWVPRQVLRALKLQGLELHWPDPWISVPLPAGGRLELWRDMARSVDSIRRVSARDAERWPQFCKRMARLARFLEALYAEPPPDPLGAGFAWRARRASLTPCAQASFFRESWCAAGCLPEKTMRREVEDGKYLPDGSLRRAK